MMHGSEIKIISNFIVGAFYSAVPAGDNRESTNVPASFYGLLGLHVTQKVKYFNIGNFSNDSAFLYILINY